MIMHVGLRSFWPAIALMPWFILGITYLLYGVRQKLRESPGSRARGLHVISVLGLAFLAVTRVASADPAIDGSRESRTCEAVNALEATSLGDRLYANGEYQRAGECYQAAGDLVHANLAFLKAAGPASDDAARGLKGQGAAAKALFADAARAFRAKH